MNKLGIIGGGAMGSALLKGILDKGLIAPNGIYLAETDPLKREKLQTDYRIKVSENLSEIVAASRILLLAVKPNVIPKVLQQLEPMVDGGYLVISIAAGVTLTTLESKLGQARCIRVMPNTPARIGKGVSAYALGTHATVEDDQKVAEILGCVGKVVKLPEHLLDAVTAVSGSGPAYVYYFIEALINAGVMIGLSRTDACVLVTETVSGSVELLRETGEEPGKLKNDVTSPGGTTAAALFELEQGACAGIIMKAVLAASEKSQELGKKHG